MKRKIGIAAFVLVSMMATVGSMVLFQNRILCLRENDKRS